MSAIGLVADIGGTNARFALAPPGGGIAEPRTLRTADHGSLADALAAYLAAVGEAPATALLAVAGVPIGDVVQITNCPWRFSVADIRRRFGFADLAVINDFAANAWALPELGHDDLMPIGPALPTASASTFAVLGPPLPNASAGTFAVLGPGTGLGVGALRVEPDGRRIVLETEGGHVGFAPASPEEVAVLAVMTRWFGRVSAERLLCGQGLSNLYRALAAIEGDDVAPPPPEAITAATDPRARSAVALFCDILGGFAGDVALMVGAWGGVYLAGGLLDPMRDALAGGGFRRRFEDKGRFAPLLGRVPTAIVTHPHAGLLGAAAALRNRGDRR